MMSEIIKYFTCRADAAEDTEVIKEAEAEKLE